MESIILLLAVICSLICVFIAGSRFGYKKAMDDRDEEECNKLVKNAKRNLIRLHKQLAKQN